MITIIGAGPAGCYTAFKLAKNHDVNVFEEHNKIGLPVQCTGITTSLLDNYVKGDFIVNKIKQFEIIPPNHKSVIIPTKEYIIDRTKFDQHIANMAVDAGANIHNNCSFIKGDKNKIVIKNKSKLKEIKYNHLIGADGPLSAVSKNYDFRKNQFLHGIQARVDYKSEADTVKVILDNKIAPGFFAWIVPESEKVARVGLAAKHQTNHYFKRFLKKIKHKKILNIQSGLIPIYNRKKVIQKNNVYLVGDAAAQVKATTGGGIIQGFQATTVLTHAINNNSIYNPKQLNRELYLHKMVRQFLNTFSNSDYNDLVSYCNQNMAKNVLLKHTRDKPISLILRLLTAQPKFFKFIKNLPKSL